MNKTVLGEVRRKIANKSTPLAAAPSVTVVQEVSPSVSAPELKKADLINQIVENTGMKKKDVKPVVEATLALLGETLAKGQEMNLQPFGRVKVNNTKELAKAHVHSVRIRQSKAGLEDAADQVADAAE